MIRGVDYIGVSVLCYCRTEDGLWVVHKRGRKCSTPDVFNFVTGKLEMGEQPRECAFREVLEEYGCEPLSLTPLEPHMSVLERDGMRFNWLMLPYIVTINSGDLDPSTREVAEIAIVERLDEIPTPHHPALMASLAFHRHALERQ